MWRASSIGLSAIPPGVLRNTFIERWHGHETELEAVADEEATKYRKAWSEGDPDGSNTFVGEVVGLIRGIEPATEIINRMIRDAESRFRPFTGKS